MTESDQPHSDQPRTDAEIVERVEALVAEAHELQRGPDALDAEGSRRMREIEVERDRLWDLKRLREARRDAGEDPDAAVERPANVVENYRQ